MTTFSTTTIPAILKNLAGERPVFHSEMDFQLALAWCWREMFPHFQFRLEYPLDLSSNKHCDIVILADGRIVMAIELKYLTEKLEYKNEGEVFKLNAQGAQLVRRHGILKDIERMEGFLEKNPAAQASVIVITNRSIYWRGSGKGTDDEEFDIQQGATITGVRKWKGADKKWKREKGSVKISGTYKMEWQDYSEVDGKFGLFRYLHVPIQ